MAAAIEARSVERRSEKRWNLIAPLGVYKHHGEVLLGHAVNVSLHGMLVVSERVISLEQRLEIDIEVPGGAGTWEKTPIVAHSVRSYEDNLAGVFKTGFKFEHVSAHAVFSLQRLIDRLASFS